jgi:hypothetical protein
METTAFVLIDLGAIAIGPVIVVAIWSAPRFTGHAGYCA